MSGDHSNRSIAEIGQITKKGSGDLMRLALTQTPTENHQLIIFTNPSARAGYDTRSIFKRNLTV